MSTASALAHTLGFDKQEWTLEESIDDKDVQGIDILHKQIEHYVKTMELTHETDINLVEEEIKKRNMVLLSILSPMINDYKLKEAISRLTIIAGKNGGDIARVDLKNGGVLVILTPTNAKIVKERAKSGFSGSTIASI